MRIVALDAIPDCRRMHRLGRIRSLLVVTTEAERLRRRGRQLYAGDILGDADFMADQISVSVCKRTSSRPSRALLRISTTIRSCPNGRSAALSLVEITHGPAEFCDCNHTVRAPA